MKTKKSPSSIIYGARAVLEAMEAGQQLDKVLIRKGLEAGLRKDVLDTAREAGIPVQQVPEEKIERLVRGANHQGVAAFLALVSYVDLEEVVLAAQEKGEVPLIIALDQVSDVRNFGAIARSAECMGAHAIVIPQQGAARINGDAIKISAGALHHLPVARVGHIVDMVYLLQSCGLKIVACTEKASESIFQTDLTGPTCLIMGSEESGISARILKQADQLCQIPMQGKIASLNVSVAAGIVLSEISRQRYFS